MSRPPADRTRDALQIAGYVAMNPEASASRVARELRLRKAFVLPVVKRLRNRFPNSRGPS